MTKTEKTKSKSSNIETRIKKVKKKQKQNKMLGSNIENRYKITHRLIIPPHNKSTTITTTHNS